MKICPLIPQNQFVWTSSTTSIQVAERNQLEVRTDTEFQLNKIGPKIILFVYKDYMVVNKNKLQYTKLESWKLQTETPQPSASFDILSCTEEQKVEALQIKLHYIRWSVHYYLFRMQYSKFKTWNLPGLTLNFSAKTWDLLVTCKTMTWSHLCP